MTTLQVNSLPQTMACSGFMDARNALQGSPEHADEFIVSKNACNSRRLPRTILMKEVCLRCSGFRA